MKTVTLKSLKKNELKLRSIDIMIERLSISPVENDFIMGKLVDERKKLIDLLGAEKLTFNTTKEAYYGQEECKKTNQETYQKSLQQEVRQPYRPLYISRSV